MTARSMARRGSNDLLAEELRVGNLGLREGSSLDTDTCQTHVRQRTPICAPQFQMQRLSPPLHYVSIADLLPDAFAGVGCILVVSSDPVVGLAGPNLDSRRQQSLSQLVALLCA